MDVQHTPTLFSSLNSATRPLASMSRQNWTDALNFAPANLAGAAQALAKPAPSNKAFANLLSEAIEARPASEKTPQASAKEQALREKFQMIVNKFFIGSMLKQMRDSPFKSEMFSGGKGGEAFQGLMDQRLSENAGGKVAKSLVDSMVKRATRPKGDPSQLYLDSQQQRQLDTYLESKSKRDKHDATTTLTA